jgi:hypothetical protein
MRPAETHVVTETILFGPDVAHHVVVVGEGEHDRHRLFDRRPRKGLGRHQDRTNDRIFSSSTKSSFEFGRFDDGVPMIEHASLDAFFKAIGYSFARNTYAARPACEQAANDSSGSGTHPAQETKTMSNCGTCVHFANGTCGNTKSMANGIAMLADEGCSEHQGKPVAANDDAPIADAI